eukprot:6461307-Pyramimonas_sp.AAC.1
MATVHHLPFDPTASGRADRPGAVATRAATLMMRSPRARGRGPDGDGGPGPRQERRLRPLSQPVQFLRVVA